ncbi:hypothetical protein GCM10009680_07700 [Streptomyces yatensis]|uniref:Uncharacterized protein n=1 Tax=Streptomyces yatensis TaxID=155177 RepID=A0ABN2GFL9_9ACTN
MGRQLLGMEGGREYAVPQGHHHLDDTGHARRALCMANVGLERAEPQRPVLRPVPAVRGDQRVGFDRVAQLGARAMRLHRVHLGRGQPGAGEGLADHPLLGGAVRRGESVAGAVLVDGRATDQGEHLMPVAPGVGEPFQQDESDAFAPSGAVGVYRKRLAPTVRGQPPLPGEAGEHLGGGHHRHPARQGQGALLLPQCLAGQMDRDQG